MLATGGTRVGLDLRLAKQQGSSPCWSIAHVIRNPGDRPRIARLRRFIRATDF
jgi:hypothetical protein